MRLFFQLQDLIQEKTPITQSKIKRFFSAAENFSDMSSKKNEKINLDAFLDPIDNDVDFLQTKLGFIMRFFRSSKYKYFLQAGKQLFCKNIKL